MVFAAPSQLQDDYTEEELQIFQRVEQEGQERKRKLYEKQLTEQNDKDDRKRNAQN